MNPPKPASLPRRLWQGLDKPTLQDRAMWIVPLLFGLISVLLRQDDNWDLRNYHLYNPFAWLNGKIGFDLAPAQMQSYFNPTLDLLYYGLVHALPGPLAGFVMGALHGLNFVLLLLIGRALLPQQQPHRGRLALLLALAGMFGAGFVSQIGNTMGDNMTALFILGALLVLLRRWQVLAAAGLALLGAGLLAGLGTGLKLTNAVYALALCLSLFALPASFLARLRCMFTFGIGVLLGMAASAGHWYWKMWTMFGNPLFPQFNNLFHGPLASPMAVGDTNWLPQGWIERLLWPFVFALDPRQVSEIRLSLLVWPILYVAFILLGMHLLARRDRTSAPDGALRSHHAMLWLFFGLAYLVWMNLFSIYRYLVPLELLAPLVLWLIAQRLKPGPQTARLVAALLLVVVAAALVKSPSWGRAKWAGESFHAEVPAIAQPEESLVFTVHGDPPMGWLVTMFPARLAFVSLSSGFPESDLYRARVGQMVAERSGPLYVMTKSDDADGTTLQRARQVLDGYGLSLVPGSCRPYRAFVGKNPFDYQLCNVNGRAGTPR
ncbi:hypothetical protein [Massilia suwonensis]|uniref:DUF2029 domain-containing protein n=1 Tax=Massilia suwonensis TaxID=648895 RepID=A0ABW0MP93_9BURK